LVDYGFLDWIPIRVIHDPPPVPPPGKPLINITLINRALVNLPIIRLKSILPFVSNPMVIDSDVSTKSGVHLQSNLNVLRNHWNLNRDARLIL